MGSRIVFLDVESTGLDPLRHKLWNVGMVIRYSDGTEDDHEWMWWPDLSTADPMALRVNHFYDRAGQMLGAPWSEGFGDVAYVVNEDLPYLQSHGKAAHNIAHYLDGATIVGAIPSFDVNFLTPWLREHGHVYTGHYHLIDIEALVAGFLFRLNPPRDAPVEAKIGMPPWKSDDLSKEVGVDPEDFDRHTALGDAKWARALWDAVVGSA